jgi:hypothetical protein
LKETRSGRIGKYSPSEVEEEGVSIFRFYRVAIERRYNVKTSAVSGISFRIWLKLTDAVEENSMRMLIALLVIAYLVGVGVTLAPTIRANWTTAPVSQFVDSVGAELPRALAWPAAAYRGIADTPAVPEKPVAPEKPVSAQ